MKQTKQICINREGTIFMRVDEDVFEDIKDKTIFITSHGYPCISEYLGIRPGKEGPGSAWDKYQYKKTYVHHWVMGKPRKGLFVDHIDGNKLNNCRDNLRFCTPGSSARNTGQHGAHTSIYHGVHTNKRGRWLAQITYKYKCHHLGTFDTEKAAALAYNQAARRFHGKYARLNVVA